MRSALFWEETGREEHAATQQVVPKEKEVEEGRQEETDRETAREGEKERGIA